MKEKSNIFNDHGYKTKVVFHQDPIYESEKDTVVHSRKEGDDCANTMCKRGKFPQNRLPVMKSWVLPGQEMPRSIVKEVDYIHPNMNEAYHKAGKALQKAQSTLGLNFGGILAGFNDSHESGLSVALENAARISQKAGFNPQDNAFLKDFIETIHIDNNKQRTNNFAKLRDPKEQCLEYRQRMKQEHLEKLEQSNSRLSPTTTVQA